MEALHSKILAGSLDPPTLAGSYWKLLSPLARSSQAPLGFCADKNWLSAPQIKKTHSDPGKCIKGGQILQLPECGRGGRGGAHMSGNAACFLSRPSEPSTGWPSPQEAHSWLTPHLQNSQNSARATTMQPAPQPPASHARTLPPKCLCPVISFGSPHSPGATGQALPCFSRHRSGGRAV